MTRAEATAANRAILQTWIDDSDGEHDAATDRALNHLRIEIVEPGIVRAHADRWREEYPHVADVLNQLASKLHELPVENTTAYIERRCRTSANYQLVETWLLDTPDRTLANRYVRALLAQLLCDERHGLPITIGRVQHMADSELVASNAADADSETRELCSEASDVLRALVSKLH